MNFKRIDRWSLRYQFLRAYVKFAHNLIFYRKICVTGKENLPDNTPLFFAPNHQNALMDALIILCSIKQQPVFIARADIFKNPLIARILVSLKILPAYRIRDGKENLEKNEETFDVSVRILENKNILTLFPETTHTDKRQLRILKKGVQRIVFQAEEKNDFKLGIKIIPVGIYYSNYWNFKTDIQLNFGKPIDLTEYNETYKTNSQKAMLALRDRISDEIIPLIIHIKSEDYYTLFEFLREFYNKKMRAKLSMNSTLQNKFIADKKTIEVLDKFSQEQPEAMKTLNISGRAYQKKLKVLNIRNWVVDKDLNTMLLILKSLGLIILLPIFIYGWLNNALPYYLPQPLRKKIKDRQFMSSINFVAGIILYPLFYLLQFALVWMFFEPVWIKYAYLLSLPISGLLAFNIHRNFIKLKSQWKYKYFKKHKGFEKFIGLKKQLDSFMDDIADKYFINFSR